MKSPKLKKSGRRRDAFISDTTTSITLNTFFVWYWLSSSDEEKPAFHQVEKVKGKVRYKTTVKTTVEENNRRIQRDEQREEEEEFEEKV